MTDESFAGWLRGRMVDLMVSAADLERRTGVNASLISKWRRGLAVPSMANLHRLAPVLGEDVQVLAARAGHLDAATPADVPGRSPDQHPLVRDLARMLDDDSPVPDDEREVLVMLVDRVIQPYRRHIRRRRAG